MQCKSSFFNKNLLQALHVVLTASLGLYGRVACNAKQGNQWMQSPLHENTNSESVQFVLTKICEFGDPWMCWPISESTLEPSANWKFEFFYNNFPTSGRNDDFSKPETFDSRWPILDLRMEVFGLKVRVSRVHGVPSIAISWKKVLDYQTY